MFETKMTAHNNEHIVRYIIHPIAVNQILEEKGCRVLFDDLWLDNHAFSILCEYQSYTYIVRLFYFDALYRQFRICLLLVTIQINIGISRF